MKNKIFRFSFKNLIFSGVAALLMLIISIIATFYNPLGIVDSKLNDAMYQHVGDAAPEILLVGIDDETIENYGAYDPVEYRGYFANILNMWDTKGYHPDAIGFDVIFNKARDCDTVDSNLKSAMLKHNVILGVNGMSRTESPYIQIPCRDRLAAVGTAGLPSIKVLFNFITSLLQWTKTYIT